MLIALSLSMISLVRSTKKYTQALDHFKQQLQEAVQSCQESGITEVEVQKWIHEIYNEGDQSC